MPEYPFSEPIHKWQQELIHKQRLGLLVLCAASPVSWYPLEDLLLKLSQQFSDQLSIWVEEMEAHPDWMVRHRIMHLPTMMIQYHGDWVDRIDGLASPHLILARIGQLIEDHINASTV